MEGRMTVRELDERFTAIESVLQQVLAGVRDQHGLTADERNAIWRRGYRAGKEAHRRGITAGRGPYISRVAA